MANAGAKLSSFPEVNDIQTGDMFPLLSGGNTNAKIDYATLADAIIAKLKSETGDGVLSINGKTGAVTLSKADVGLGNVDNTSDADKPVSTAVQNALDGKANNSVATSSADGLMSKADKAKLDDIGTGSNVKSVNGKTGAVTLAKGDVGLSSVANLDQSKAIKSITRSGTTFTATALDGTTTTFTQQDSNTTYGVATSSTDGLMSKTDKAKLDGISSGADAVTIKTVKVNGTALTPDSDKAVNVTVPTLANNATTTAGGMALDARMGKTLSDQASQFAKNTAQIESAGTATNAHSAGEYVMISNALYKVAASVAKGDTWTIGTNVTAANIGSEIGSLKSDLANHINTIENRVFGFSKVTLNAINLNMSYSECFRYGNLLLLKIYINIGVDINSYSKKEIFEIQGYESIQYVGAYFPINIQDKSSLLLVSYSSSANKITVFIETKGGSVSADDWIIGSLFIPIAV